MRNIMLPDQDNCLRGYWADGECRCDQDYITLFSDTTLHPFYCNIPLANLKSGSFAVTPDMLALGLMAWSVAGGILGIIVLLVFVQCLWSLHSLSKTIQGVRQDRFDFMSKQLRREKIELVCHLWEQSTVTFSCVYDATAERRRRLLNARVLHEYKAKEKDELSLSRRGDIISEVIKLENGWCKGQFDTKVGFFPTAYVELYYQKKES